MSIPVDVADLARVRAGFAFGYLLTAREGRVKAVAVDPVVVEDVVRIAGPGRGSLANVAADGQVTLLFPPTATSEPAGMTLLVDGTGAVEDDGVVVTPTGAVLHRPADHT